MLSQLHTLHGVG